MAAGLACWERLFTENATLGLNPLPRLAPVALVPGSHAIVEPAPRTGNREDKNSVSRKPITHPWEYVIFAEKMLLRWVQWPLQSLSPWRPQHTVMYTAMRQGSMLFVAW